MAFSPALQASKCSDCGRAYISSCHDFYLNSARVPKPVLYGIFNFIAQVGRGVDRHIQQALTFSSHLPVMAQ